MEASTYMKKSQLTPLNSSREEILSLKGAVRVMQPVLRLGGSMFN